LSPGTLTPMPEEPDEKRTERGGGFFTGFGIGSAALGLVSVAAVVLGLMIWSGHRSETDERAYQTTVLQAAADWTNVLINMNSDTVDTSLRTLHDGTVGQLNADFETTVEPFKQLVLKLKSQTAGQVDSVSIESLHHQLPGPSGAPTPQPELSTVASRTDTVLVVATSVSQNAGGAQPQPVRWNLRLGVSDVDGKLLISRLETIR
jgi:hypothetical protein